MIQRIQTVYLLLTTVLSGLFLNGNILRFINTSGMQMYLKLTGIYSVSSGQTDTLIQQVIPFSAVGILIPLFSLVTVFLFRNRKLQLRFSLAVIVLLAALILILTAYSVCINKEFNVLPATSLKAILPLLSLFTAIMAYRGIRKDIKLVSSYDRLR